MAQDNTTENQASGGVLGAGIFGLKINGEAPPPSRGLIVNCFIIENQVSVPAILLTLNDTNNMFRNDYALVDGTKLEVTMGTTKEQCRTYNFRVFSVKEGQSAAGSTILEVLALFDFPKFLFDTKSWVVKGNSQTAIQTIATDCGLEFDTDQTTSDVMKWVSAATSARQFISVIQRHMYLNEDAYLSTILDAQGKIICRDLTRQMTRKPQHKMCYNFVGEPGSILVQEIQHKSVAGTMNAAYNYGEKIVWNSSDGNTNTLSTLSHVAADPLNVNSDIRDSLAAARKTYVANTTDINYHENWVRAEYTNKRNAAAYTDGLRVLILGQEPAIELYDSVDLQAGLSDSNVEMRPDPKISGQWIVVGRTRTFADNRYSTMYFLSRNTTTVTGTTEVGGGKNKEPTPFETVAAMIRPYQFNFNISQMLNELSPIEALAGMQEGLLSDLKEGFKEMSDKYGFTELYEKYGEAKDNLMSLMQEFNIARWLTGMCQTLNALEKLSVSMSIELGDTILQDLASRLDQMDALGSTFTNQINGLIANGDIPESYMNGPQINQRCVSNKLDDLNRSIQDSWPDKCMDAFSIGRLLGPSMNLAQLVRETEEHLRNMLCALGDGTVDGSSDKGTTDGKQLDQYLPHGSWTLQR